MGAEPAFEEVAVGGDAGQQLARVGGLQDPHRAVGHALRQIGIEAYITVVDQAQYNERRTGYEFDMIVNAWNMSLSPGNEQALYWGRSGVTTPGSRNYAGIDSPSVEAMIATSTSGISLMRSAR